MRPSVSPTEAALFAAEAVAAASFVAVLHVLGPREHPNTTWKLVMMGVVISAAPAIALARIEPAPSWQRYEARALAGFFVSAAFVVPWQLLLAAERRGEIREYQRNCRYDPTTPLE